MTQQIAEAEGRDLSLCGVAPFNLNSPQQLGSVLFNTLGLPAKKKTARGYSTDADTLSELAELHPAVEKILLYRQVAKLKEHLYRRPAPADGPRRAHSHVVRPDHRRDGGASPPVSRICRISRAHADGARNPPRVHRPGR